MTALRAANRPIRATARLAAAAALLAVVAAPAGSAQETTGPAFDQFTVEGSSIPLAVGFGVPTYLPLAVDVGIGFTGVKASSTPQVRATAEPIWVPVASALDLLGGPGVLVPIALGLVPELVPSLPVVFGGEPLELPFEVPRLPLPPIPLPSLPSVQCTAATPGDTPERNCGVPNLDLGGAKLQTVGAEATTAGEPDDISTVAARAEVNLGGSDTSEVASFGTANGYLVHSRTEQLVDDGTLVVTAEAAAADVDVFGALKIDAVQARLEGRLDGIKAGTLERDCTLTGATLMGIPLALTADGLRLGSEGVGADANPLLALAPELFKAFNAGVRSLSLPYDVGTLTIEVGGGAEAKTSVRAVTGAVDCLTVTYAIPASSTKLQLSLGRTSLKMSVAGGVSEVDDGVAVVDETGGIVVPTPTADGSIGGLEVAPLPDPTPGALPPAPHDEVAVGPEPVAVRRADWAPAVPVAGLLATLSVLAGRLRRLRRLPGPPAVVTDG